MNSKKLFIHIPKNAGLTVRRFLKDRIVVCDGKNTFINENYKSRLTKTMERDHEHHGYEHARWRDVSKHLTNNYQAFAIVRNPWMKVGSRYMYGLRLMEKGAAPKGYMPTSFEEFLEERFKYQDREFYWHRVVKGWYNQLDHVIDKNDCIRCDILRFENFDHDIKVYFNLPKGCKIKSSNNFHRNNKDPKWSKWDIDYKSLYTDKTIQIIADWYMKDIDTWGFDFDTGPTKNYWSLNDHR